VGEIVIADFEDPARADLFAKEAFPLAAISTERAAQGRCALKLEFEQFQAGKPQWPMISLHLEALKAPDDWSGHARLAMDVYTPTPGGGVIRILTNDGQQEWYTRLPVAPDEWRTVRLALSDIAACMDLTRVKRLSVYMTRPEKPTTFFVDNIRLEPWDIASAEAVEVILVKPAFNRGFYHSNPETEVAVRVTVKAPPEQCGRLLRRLSLHGPDGQPLGPAVSSDSTLRQETLATPKPALGAGDCITARFELKRGDQTLHRREFAITRYARNQDEVVLRDDGVTLVNGEPFFPLGMYQSPVPEFSTLKRMGFNTVHTYRPADAAYMEAAAQAGLRVISAVKGTYSAPPNYHEPKWREPDVAAYVKTLMDAPALLAYYMFDEPSPGFTPSERLQELCDIPRRIDPYHLSVGCNNAHQHAYRRVPDAMMVDAYPAPGPMASLLARMREGAKAQAPSFAVWFIPQAFSWEPYFRTARAVAGQRPPTFDEVRTMPWLAIAIGARGLIYYSWQTQGFYIRDAYPVFWKGFEHHVAELVALFPWLLEREPGEPVRCSNPAVFIAARQRGDDLLVAAANSDLKPTRAAIVVPGLAGRQLHVVSENRVVQPRENAVELSFDGLETHILTTSATGLTSLPTLSEIREEQVRLAAEFAERNPSICTVRDGATLDASWGFPGPAEVDWASWRRMIDGFPGTSWIVGSAFRAHALKDWKEKDFASPGRWIEVRFPAPKRVNLLRAIASPWAEVELRVFDGARWLTVQGTRVVDQPARHHSRPSATITARFDPLDTDRFRAVFPKPRKKAEVVFELSAAMVE